MTDEVMAQPAGATLSGNLQPTNHWQTGGVFGYSGDLKRFGPTNNDPTPFDDAVVAALSEDEPNPLNPAAPFTDLGAIYLFESDGQNLGAHPVHARIQPQMPWNANMEFGRLDAIVGDVRNGAGAAVFNPLLFLSAARRDVYDTNCVAIGGSPLTLPEHGSVEMFDANSLIGTTPTTILPPKEPLNPCNTQLVRWFGHAIAVGDVVDFAGGPTPDGIDDLIVGAPLSRADIEMPRHFYGRVYVFAGHANFFNDPAARFVAIKAPIHPASVSGADAAGVAWNEYRFGFDLAADDLDGDGFAEIVIGRPGVGGTAADAGAGPGRAYIFSGSWINQQIAAIPYGQKGIVVAPAGSPTPGQYQMLVDPSNNCGGAIEPQHAFGWNVWMPGDVGAPSPYGVDALARPDVFIHAEGSDFQCPGQAGFVDRAGAHFVFFNNGAGWVEPMLPVKLQQLSAATVETVSRIGRAAVTLDWIDCASGSPVVRRAAVIGEPGPGPPGNADKARTWLLWTPITPASVNAWPAALLDPTIANPATERSSSFAAWMMKGRYRDPALTPLGEQLIITARDKTYTIGGTTYTRAGECHVFLPVCPGP